MPLFFWSDLYLEARAEILKKNLVGCLVQTMTPKSPFEINWPLKKHFCLTLPAPPPPPTPPIFQTLHRLCTYKKDRKNDKKTHISKDSCSDYLLNCRCSNRIQKFCCKNLGEVILNRFSNFATFLLTVKNPHKIGLQNMDSVAKLLRN